MPRVSGYWSLTSIRRMGEQCNCLGISGTLQLSDCLSWRLDEFVALSRDEDCDVAQITANNSYSQ